MRGRSLRVMAVGGVAAIVVLAVAGAMWLRGDDEPAPAPARKVPAAVRAGCVGPAPGSYQLQVATDHPPVLLHVPPGTPRARRPVVVMLPGAGQTGEFAEQYTGYSALADQHGFLVAYPTAAGASAFWNVSGKQAGKPDDVAYLRSVITTLTGKDVCGDPERVGLTGGSNGGGMTAHMACAAADLLTAAASVSGGYSSLPPCHPSRHLPILEIHGLHDTIVPYRGKGPDHAGAVGTWLRGWLRRNNCTGAARRSAPEDKVQELRWTCPNGRTVIHDRVLDAQHGWPSLGAFSSTERTWRFFAGSFGRERG
jgi:polyhydroxybutyrate depolymerase